MTIMNSELGNLVIFWTYYYAKLVIDIIHMVNFSPNWKYSKFWLGVDFYNNKFLMHEAWLYFSCEHATYLRQLIARVQNWTVEDVSTDFFFVKSQHSFAHSDSILIGCKIDSVFVQAPVRCSQNFEKICLKRHRMSIGSCN